MRQNAQFWSFALTGIYYIVFEVWEETMGNSKQVEIVRPGLWSSSRNAKAKWNCGNKLWNYDKNTKRVLFSDLKARGLEGLWTRGIEGMILGLGGGGKLNQIPSARLSDSLHIASWVLVTWKQKQCGESKQLPLQMQRVWKVSSKI